MEPAKKLKSVAKKLKSVPAEEPMGPPIEQIRARQTSELVFGICGPLGGGVSTVTREFISKLAEYDYPITHLKLSKFIPSALKKVPAEKVGTIDLGNSSSEASRIENFQRAGTLLREIFEPNFLAQLAIREIRLKRPENTEVEEEVEGKLGEAGPQGELPREPRRHVCIIEGLKHPEEIELLRAVYGNMFYLLGILCPHGVKEERLKKKGMSSADAAKLIQIDESEVDVDHGQKLLKALQFADYFIRNDQPNISSISDSLTRFIELVLGKNIISPTLDEYVMHIAQSTAARSGCMSRQVGAAIINAEGELLSVGCNDVPRAGGGLYSAEDGRNDSRCMHTYKRRCNNDFYKSKIKSAIQNILSSKDIDASLADVIIKKTGIKDLTEYCRAVHAEMDAITSAARSGSKSLNGCTIYVTTYPCHNCAKHIVGVGIKKVVYIEPYEKSLATALHDDAIIVEPPESAVSIDRIEIVHFEGVAPRQFLNMFKAAGERKEDGELKQINLRKAKPILPYFVDTYAHYETRVLHYLSARGLEDIIYEE